MKISNVRLGFATNSSSSHSIILLPSGVSAPSGESSYDHEYGWEYFALTDPQSKSDYLAAMFYHEFKQEFGDAADLIMNELFDGHWDEDWYVDHNSRFSIPKDRAGKTSFTFFKELVEWIKREDVVILGGNDNSSPEEVWGDLLDYTVYPTGMWEKLVAKKDGDWWVLFNPSTGAKVRFSFVDAPEMARSRTPELVDLKITNYCTAGCKFCYQDSTRKGHHASLVDIDTILYQMGEAEVFEVAIGGGEPLEHPDFCEILLNCHDRGILPNFTTKKLPGTWHKSVVEVVKKYVGGFAISVDRKQDIANAVYSARALGLGTPVLHYVVGATPIPLDEFLAEAKLHYAPVTLLGFKNMGRGSGFDQLPVELTPETFKEVYSVSVDTAFLEQYGTLLDDLGVSEKLRVPGEGRFSMYIDAVTQQAGISSYHVERIPLPLNYGSKLQDNWEAIWK